MKWKVCSHSSPPLLSVIIIIIIIIIIIMSCHAMTFYALPCPLYCMLLQFRLLQVAHELSIPFSLANLHQVAIYIDLPAAIRETNFHCWVEQNSVFTDGAAGVSLYAALGEDKRYPDLVLSFVIFVPSTDMCIQRHQEGVPFFQSANEVILSPGINGTVPAKYISQVKDLSSWWRKVWICFHPSLQMVGLHRCLDGAMTTGWYNFNFS